MSEQKLCRGLFTPLRLRGLTLRNRVAVSPMSMYSSHDGCAGDFHLVHLGRFALGGAGLVAMEATAVTPEGRATAGDNGIWSDDHLGALRRITDFLHQYGSAAAIQLGHSGSKASSQRPWHGYGPLTDADEVARQERAWPTVAASPQAVASGWNVPHALTETDIDALISDYAAAAGRAARAGFDVIELHCAHGYLLHSFLSPLTNHRRDAYGGSLENRMRLPLRIFEAVRSEFPADRPIFVRISAIDGVGMGWSLDNSIAFARELAQRGADVIACSSGGIRLPKEYVLPSRTPGFQVSFADRIRHEAKVKTLAVGMILTPEQAEGIVTGGQADLIALGREMLFNPNWVAQAALELPDGPGWDLWPDPFGWWLKRRARQTAPRDP